MANIARIQDMSLDDAANDWGLVNRKFRAIAGPAVRLDWFGRNTSPGVTDMSAIGQAAIDAIESNGGGTLVIPPDEYYFGSPLEVGSSNVQIYAQGARITCAPTMGNEVQFDLDAVVRFVGSTSATTTLSADAAAYATTVSVASASGISIGDALFFFSSGERWYTEDTTTIRRSHINRVKDISGTTITLQFPLPRSFDTASNTVNITAYTGLRNVGITGGHWDGGGYDHPLGNGRGTAGVFFNYCQDVFYYPEYVGGFSGAQCWPSNTFGADIYIPRMRGHNDDYTDTIVGGDNAGFYGIYSYQSRAITKRGGVATRTRHAIDGARTEDVRVIGWSVYDNHQTPYTSHSGCDEWIFSDCQAAGPEGFLSWRGFNLTVTGCRCFAPNAAEGFVYDISGTGNDLGRSYNISNNYAITAREPIRINANIRECLLSNNYFANVDGGAYGSIYVGADVRTLISTGDVLESLSSGGSNQLVSGGTTPRTRTTVRFIGTKFINYADNALQLNAVTDETSLTILEGEFDSRNSVTAHVLLGSAAYRRVFVEGSDVDGYQYSIGREVEFTPVFGNSGGGTDCTLNAASSCSWSRYGNHVQIRGDIRISSLNGASGAMYLKNPPFPVSVSTEHQGGGVVHFSSGMNLTTAGAVLIRALSNNSEFLFNTQGTAGTTPLTAAQLTDTSRMVFVIDYVTDES